MRSVLALRSLLGRERPDVLFAFTIKPIVYGIFAAALTGAPAKENRHVMLTGLGYMFEGGNFIKRLLMRAACILDRAAFTRAGTVFFQNEDDRALFERLSLLPRDARVYMCRGTGVDTKHFPVRPPVTAPPVFLFVGRLLEAKGLRELRAAASRLKSRHPQARVLILGPPENGVGGVPLAEILDWQRQGVVEYLGETSDVRPHIARASVIVLPSWREGTPCSLMEGMSMGRAVIAADAPGSREVVRHGVNGVLVPARNDEALAKAMEEFILHPERIEGMGAAGRALAETEFDAEVVATGILRDMRMPDLNPVGTGRNTQ
jgi:glycosyltransferase involved in cell wall biosynthesis